MASAPIRILLLGNAKMGTTGIFNSIKRGMGEAFPDRSPILVSEPAASVASALDRYGRDHDALVKAMINKTGTRISVGGYSHTVLIVRDPRDTVVSQLLYYPLQPYGMRRTSQADLQRYIDALRDKERDPRSWSLRALFELAVETMEWEPQWSWDRYDVRFADSLTYLSKDPFVLSYEDFVDGKLDHLSEHLGFSVENVHVEAGSRTGHVIRSSGYGDWRRWFTPEDVEYFRPRWKDYMTEFGYDDWELDPQPRIDPATASEYVLKKREKVELTLRERLVDVSAWDPSELTDPAILRRIEEAAEDGGSGSMFRLARLYRQGGPLASQDLARARDHARRGAMLGNLECMGLLAQMLRDGEGGPAEPDEAWFWLHEAYKVSRRRIEDLSGRLSHATDTVRRHSRGRGDARAAPKGATVPQDLVAEMQLQVSEERERRREIEDSPAYRIVRGATRVAEHPRWALPDLSRRLRAALRRRLASRPPSRPHSRPGVGPRGPQGPAKATKPVAAPGATDDPAPVRTPRGPRAVTATSREFALPVPGTDGRYVGFDVPLALWVPKVISTGGLSAYELDTISAFLALLDISQDGPVLDVGANVGIFSLLAAATTDRTIHAFEPTPELADVVRETASANDLEVEVHQAAAGAEDGTASLYLSNTTDASNSLRAGFRDAVGTTEVTVRSLDLWCRETGTRPAVVKIDTETTEPDVVRGFMQVLGDARPYVICEVLPKTTEAELEELFGKLGYHAYQITNDIPLVKRREIFGDRTFTFRDWIFAPEPLEADFAQAYRRRRGQIEASPPPAPYVNPTTVDLPGLRFGSGGGFDARWGALTSLAGVTVSTLADGAILNLQAAFPPGESRYLSHGSYDFSKPPSDVADWQVDPGTPFSVVCPYTHLNGTIAVEAYLIGYRGEERSTHVSVRLSEGVNTLRWTPDDETSGFRLALRVSGRGRCHLGPMAAYRAAGA